MCNNLYSVDPRLVSRVLKVFDSGYGKAGLTREGGLTQSLSGTKSANVIGKYIQVNDVILS